MKAPVPMPASAPFLFPPPLTTSTVALAQWFEVKGEENAGMWRITARKKPQKRPHHRKGPFRALWRIFVSVACHDITRAGCVQQRANMKDFFC